eukprot:gene536-1023_t
MAAAAPPAAGLLAVGDWCQVADAGGGAWHGGTVHGFAAGGAPVVATAIGPPRVWARLRVPVAAADAMVGRHVPPGGSIPRG